MRSEFSPDENSAVLGVIRSFSGRFWRYRKIDNIFQTETLVTHKSQNIVEKKYKEFISE